MENDNSPEMDKEEQVKEEDRIKNLQAEFSRKQDNLASTLNDRLDSKFQELVEALKPAQPEPSNDLPQDIYDMSPADIQKMVQESVKQSVEPVAKKISEQEQVSQRQQEIQSVYADLVKDYPELADSSSEAYKVVDQEVASLGQGYNAVQFEKAILKGLRKAPKMSKDSDDFTFGGSKGSRKPASKRSKKEGLNEINELWMEALYGEGASEDPELRKRIEAHKGRKWNRYETVIKTKKGYK
jgi:uncharacterized phage infection (PIP) family protein YhgE